MNIEKMGFKLIEDEENNKLIEIHLIPGSGLSPLMINEDSRELCQSTNPDVDVPTMILSITDFVNLIMLSNNFLKKYELGTAGGIPIPIKSSVKREDIN